MFEEGVKVEFQFNGESSDGNFYVDSIPEFEMLTTLLPIEEVGISFSGEVKVGENTSVLVDEKIKLDSPEEATKTYQKVMEMRELTEAERTNVNKYKLVLKKLFDVFFRGQKYRRNLCIFWAIILGIDVAAENYFAALMMAACIAINTSPIKFAKEMKKMFGKKRREELTEELTEMNIMNHVNSVEQDEGVKLYFRPQVPNM